MSGPTLVEAWKNAEAQLRAAGVSEPAIDARTLREAGAGVSRLEILTEPRRPLSLTQSQSIAALVLRRAAREPISQILGRKPFRNIALAVTRDVLTPRPETEILLDLALHDVPAAAPARFLDLGVGSGAILAAALEERPNATGLGVDASPAALAIAEENFRRLMLTPRAELQQGHWADEVVGEFDRVFSNPPYVTASEFETLPPEVAFYEPRLALFGGVDGLDAYRAILPALPRLLKPAGAAVLECGPTQTAAIAALAETHGLRATSLAKDLAGRPRALRLEKLLGSTARSG